MLLNKSEQVFCLVDFKAEYASIDILKKFRAWTKKVKFPITLKKIPFTEPSIPSFTER